MNKALKMNIITKVECVYIEPYKFYKIWFENPANFVRISFDIERGCYENFNFSSIPHEDNFEQFVGAKIEHIKVVDTSEHDCCEYKNTVRLFIETTVGELFIEMFNEHNGYYSHDYTIEYNFYDSQNINQKLFTRDRI